MKRFFALICVLVFALFGKSVFAQKNYPALANVNITDARGNMLDPNGLPEAEQVLFTVTVLNMSQQQAVAAGACQLKISLGEKLILPKDFNVAKSLPSEYFSWSAVKDQKGNICLMGKLAKDLPIGFEGTLYVPVQCKGTGRSQVKANLVYDVNSLNNDGLNTIAFTIIPKG